MNNVFDSNKTYYALHPFLDAGKLFERECRIRDHAKAVIKKLLPHSVTRDILVHDCYVNRPILFYCSMIHRIHYKKETIDTFLAYKARPCKRFPGCTVLTNFYGDEVTLPDTMIVIEIMPLDCIDVEDDV